MLGVDASHCALVQALAVSVRARSALGTLSVEREESPQEDRRRAARLVRLANRMDMVGMYCEGPKDDSCQRRKSGL